LDEEKVAAMSSTQGDAKLFARVSTMHDKIALSVQRLTGPEGWLAPFHSFPNYHLHALILCIMTSLFSSSSGTLPKSFLDGAGLEARLPAPPTPRAKRRSLASSADDGSTPNGSLHKRFPQGKVAELRQELNSGGKKDKNNSAKKIALKKIIANMTMSNNDMVALFPDIIGCMEIASLEIKKM
jgi:hypothetical protein